MPRSPMASFSALVRTGRETGPARAVGAATIRRLVLYYGVVAALVTVMDLSMPAHAGRNDPTGGDAKPNGEPKPKNMVLRVEADDLEHGRRVVEAALAETAKKWRFERTLHRGGRTIGLEYHARLRRSHSPEAVRGRILNDGAPFVTAVEWTT